MWQARRARCHQIAHARRAESDAEAVLEAYGYTIVKDYVRERERRGREMFVPLAQPSGHAQADFGDAVVIIGGVEQEAHFFDMDMSHRDACFVRAYLVATSEAWIDGHIHAFAFFGRVPLSVLYVDPCLS